MEVDQIYNLACPASPIHYQHDPVQTTKTSVHGAINMLGLAKRLRARILQASTSEVYGDPNVHPQPEDYWGHVNPVGPRSCYDEGKRCAETLFFDYWRQQSCRSKSREFQYLRPTHAPERWAGGLELHCPGTARPGHYCIRRRVADTLILLCRRFDRWPRSVDGHASRDITGPVNIGNPGEFKIIELAQIVVDLVGSRSKIVRRPRRRMIQNSASRTFRGLKSYSAGNRDIALKEGLMKTVAYFEGLLSDHGLRALLAKEATVEPA